MAEVTVGGEHTVEHSWGNNWLTLIVHDYVLDKELTELRTQMASSLPLSCCSDTFFSELFLSHRQHVYRPIFEE